MDPGSGPVDQGAPDGTLIPVLVSFRVAFTLFCLAAISLPEHLQQIFFFSKG